MRVQLNPFRLTVAAFISGLVLLWRFLLRDHGPAMISGGQIPASQPTCSNLPGANETLVVLKTGSTELAEKLPIHLKTTVRCYPNYMIFSDYEEDYQHVHIYDALEFVDKDIQEKHPDFELHRRLKEQGRQAVISSGFGKAGTDISSWTGNKENPGWKLDKWKFLSMVKKTLLEYPEMKWYVFAEVDTYILWATLLQYLSVLDSQKSIYMGSQMYIGPDLFAHGGSGFVVSQPAMRTLVSHYENQKQALEEFTDHHWAGDCVLGKAFRDAGVKFTNGWPITQGDYPGIVPYAGPDGRPVANPSARVWCYPVATYHHVSPETVEDLWNFEQDWIANRISPDSFLRHKDMFVHYVLPRMTGTHEPDWDNECEGDAKAVENMSECYAQCHDDPECRQFSFEQNGGLCRTRKDPRLGVSKADFRSGWLLDRMEEFVKNMAPCGDEGWLT